MFWHAQLRHEQAAGYPKALRWMKTAEKFKLPALTFVDTPDAYPGVDTKELGQSEAIGRNIFEVAQLEAPTITTITGEGDSGRAFALAGDRSQAMKVLLDFD